MAKKRTKKKSVKKKTRKTAKKTTISSKSIEVKMQPVLVNNFVALQKVMVNLSTKLDNLTSQLSKLLDTFELSAKSLAKKDFKLEAGQDNKEVLKKLNDLSEQNKLLAKGMTLMHESAAEQPYAPPMPVPTPMRPPRPIPMGMPETGEYKKSPSKPLKSKPEK